MPDDSTLRASPSYAVAQHGHIGAATSPGTTSVMLPPAAPHPVWPPAPSSAQITFPQAYENTSGTDGTIPPEIARLKWSWGAFGIGWIWLSRHGMQGWAALVFIAGFVEYVAFGAISPLLRFPLSFVIPVILGIKGPQLAWRRRRYESVEHYLATERVWANWGIGLFSFILVMIVLAILLPLIVMMRLRAEGR